MNDLALPRLPTGWTRVQLDSICEINPRAWDTPSTVDERVSFVAMAAVEPGTGILDPSQERPWGELEKKTYTKFHEGDVLFAKVTPCMENGKIAVASGLRHNRGVGSTEFHVLRPSDGIYSRYLLHYLLQTNFRAEAERAMSGAVGLRRVPATFLKDHLLPLPPLAEQHRIVETLEDHLSRLDVAEHLTSQSVARARRRLQESISAITYGYIVPGDEPSAPPPVPCGTNDGVLPNLPPSWSWKRLEEIADVVGGVTKDKKKQSDPNLPELPYLRVANVQRGWLDLSDVSNIRVPVAKVRQLALQHGDVLLNEGGDRDKLGRGWIWEDQLPVVIHQNHVFRARIRDDAIHPKLLSWYANSSAHWFETNGKQSVNLASISLSKIKNLPVPVPPRDEQSKILERIEKQISVIETAAGLCEQALTKARVLRRALLARAFTGKLVPQDPADEPASKLLDRVYSGRTAHGDKHKRSRASRRTPTAASVPPPPPAASDRPLTDAVQQELPL